jgi:uncharacterized phage protein (TIGR01671 family)
VREIRFRGIEIRTKKFVYGSLIVKNYHAWIIDDSVKTKQCMCDIKITSKPIPVDIETVGQYTGLQSRNGVWIYDGDIFKTRNGVVAVVEWDENNGRFLGFTIERERKIVYVGQEPAVEVIGNIHQNADLLINEA